MEIQDAVTGFPALVGFSRFQQSVDITLVNQGIQFLGIDCFLVLTAFYCVRKLGCVFLGVEFVQNVSCSRKQFFHKRNDPLCSIGNDDNL